MTSPVLFETLDTANGMKVGVATLNSPKTLNGLSLAMCELLAQQLTQWETDASIAFVILKGAGDRAFCAGGDLHGLYQAMLDNTSGEAWNNPHARTFFDVEYRLDYQLHTYPKPVLCWGNGIVMGGGVGLFMAASHRVVSETTRYAMPEITIGLFPDVGGTWMLSRLPAGMGVFLALTGAQLGASDCEFLGLADYTLESTRWDDLMAAIGQASWSAVRQDNDNALADMLLALKPAATLPQGPLRTHYDTIRQTCDGPNFTAICNGIQAWSDHEDAWLKRAAATFLAGAPGSARLSYALLRRVRLLSLADVFREEYVVSLQCGVQGDFQEGIRALLIDKDKQPKWNPATLDQADDAWVQRYFASPWPASVAHPLADLGQA
ncbi:enoyl-CoA hydratase/isomerase family protein [Alcaligenaceae bacterium]|nr:enoyl-CoA hydratase/isomerase family protein [Alcaligenaceae bacterium]